MVRVAVRYLDFDAKLRMTATVLSCVTRKEFVARFRAVNKASECDIERMHKWLQGRALPRSLSVVQDWTKLLGSGRPAEWIASCTLDEFAAELAGLFERDAEELLATQAFFGRGSRTARAPSAADPLFGGVRFLCGAYACYSPSWSPYTRGRLIRSSFVIAPARGTSLVVTYSEMLLGKSVSLTGELRVAHRLLYATLTEAGSEVPIFFSLFMPRPPAAVMTGIMAGATFVSPEPEPSASRIVMVRVPDAAALDDSNRYVVPAPGVVADDLEALGLDVASCAGVDGLIQGFLMEQRGPEQIAPSFQTQLAAQLDPAHLRGTTRKRA